MNGYTTRTDLANLALSNLGSGKAISDIDTDKSAEAMACRQYIDIAIDEMLRGFSWPFATKIVKLGLVEVQPSTEWAYAYRYPSDSLMPRRILSGVRNDTRPTRVSYRLFADDSGKLIYTDREVAEIEYTSVIGRNPGRWDADFLMATSYRLSAYISPRVTGGDPFKNGDKCLQLWNLSIKTACKNAANEEQMDDIPQGESILARF